MSWCRAVLADLIQRCEPPIRRQKGFRWARSFLTGQTQKKPHQQLSLADVPQSRELAVAGSSVCFCEDEDAIGWDCNFCVSGQAMQTPIVCENASAIAGYHGINPVIVHIRIESLEPAAR
jgi:hypothetical protein